MNKDTEPPDIMTDIEEGPAEEEKASQNMEEQKTANTEEQIAAVELALKNQKCPFGHKMVLGTKKGGYSCSQCSRQIQSSKEKIVYCKCPQVQCLACSFEHLCELE